MNTPPTNQKMQVTELRVVSRVRSKCRHATKVQPDRELTSS
jgi:hypothetical protein